jgi:hypothetical protein
MLGLVSILTLHTQSVQKQELGLIRRRFESPSFFICTGRRKDLRILSVAYVTSPVLPAGYANEPTLVPAYRQD